MIHLIKISLYNLGCLFIFPQKIVKKSQKARLRIGDELFFLSVHPDSHFALTAVVPRVIGHESHFGTFFFGCFKVLVEFI